MKWTNIKDSFIVPKDQEVILRYLNQEHTLDLLDSQELYFSKADSHGEYAEGVLTIAD